MDDTTINYVIYIAATPENLWDTLTNPEALKKNWGIIESQWTVGSAVSEVSETGRVLWKGDVLESERPRLLSFTFQVIGDVERTEVRFELSARESFVGLTVTQLGFQPNSKLFQACARAWPEIMSSFKSYIETGRSLRFGWKH
jgi:uncharacterized protein YndB with AHSA1/START domain